MNTITVLRKARALIKKGWAKGWFAKDARGEDVCAWNPLARRWCMFGAIQRVTQNEVSNKGAAIACLMRAVPTSSLVDWNDVQGRERAQVLAAFDRAIKACK